jgi:hypothetical protein
LLYMLGTEYDSQALTHRAAHRILWWRIWDALISDV